MSNKSSYHSILKATSLFGGVQVFQIIIGIIRSKLIAILVGPVGMGISGLLQISIGMIGGITNFGLSNSAIKDISAAYADGDLNKVHRIISVFKQLVWLTGILGAVVTLIFSPLLSHLTFGNSKYSWAFALLSITLLINQITSGYEVIMRSMRQIKLSARASLLGSFLGLISTIPLYYYLGINGIVPALIISTIISLISTWFFALNIPINYVKISFRDLSIEGKEILKLGFLISLSGTTQIIFSYFVRIYIGKLGTIGDVGLYNAGFAIVNTYVGMIFNAMAIDYYPKLSSVSQNLKEVNDTINQQAEIAILILSPMILIFIVFIKWVIILLYSNFFLPVEQMLLFSAVGMLFKAMSWAIAFLFLAKGLSKLFFWSELIAQVYTFLLSIYGYHWSGLTGLGIAFFISYILYFFQVLIISMRLLQFKLSRDLIGIFVINLLIALIGLGLALSLESINPCILGVPLILISIFYNMSYLNTKLDIFASLSKFINKFKK